MNLTKKNYMIASFHSPLNISLLTTTPLGWFLNSKNIWNQWTNLFCVLNRVPIFIYNPPTENLKKDTYWSITNFRSFFATTQTTLNQVFGTEKMDDTTKNIFQSVASRVLGEVAKQTEENGTDRKWTDDAAGNAIFVNRYAVGQFTGMTSPQANDFYSETTIENLQSDFNNVTIIKCIFQIAMLGSIYATDWQFYTLSNAAVFLYNLGRELKFTGKFWLTPYNKIKDRDEKEKISTINIVNRILSRIESDENLAAQIKKELDIKTDNKLLWHEIKKSDLIEHIHIERTYTFPDKDLQNRELKASLELSQKLFLSTTGLENFLKDNFALAFSGILGHTWDMLLRFFEPNDNRKVTEKEIEQARKKSSNFYFLKHLGTPIASYLFDLKDDTIQNDALQGYNSLNFGRILNENLMTLSDRLKNTTYYSPQNTPNCLIPITFAPTLLQCNTKCYRSYRTLLKILKSRKQRDFIFERLTQYGRRAMTILDPYGIFMFFHKDLKGIPSN